MNNKVCRIKQLIINALVCVYLICQEFSVGESKSFSQLQGWSQKVGRVGRVRRNIPIFLCLICLGKGINETAHEIFGTFRPPLTHSLNTYAQPSSWVRCLIFSQSLCLFPLFMSVNSEGSSETVRMPEPSLVAYAISTIIS